MIIRSSLGISFSRKIKNKNLIVIGSDSNIQVESDLFMFLSSPSIKM